MRQDRCPASERLYSEHIAEAWQTPKVLFFVACGSLCRCEECAHDIEFARSFEWWQALPDSLAVRFGNQSRITNHQNAAIRLITNQTSRALLQVDDGRR